MMSNSNVKKVFTILAGAGTADTIIQAAISDPNCGGAGGGSLCAGASNVILVQADNVISHDLAVDGDNPLLTSAYDIGGANIDARNGIITNHPVGTFDGLEVYNTTVRNIYLRGLYASSGGTFNFHDNTVMNVKGESQSIAIFNFAGSGTMANNTVSDVNDAIAANWSKGTQFLNNTVSDSGSGVHTDNAGSGSTVADLIQGNTITDCAVGLSAWGQAQPVTTQFTNNIVTGRSMAVGSVGAYITTDQIGWGYNDVSVNFSGNVITGFETGIELTADEQTWTPGWVSKTVTATFHLNQIDGNTIAAQKGTTGTYVADLESNWWGSRAGPSGIADLDYTPWCGDAACSFLVSPVGVGTYEDTDTNWNYGGNWMTWTGSGPSSNNSHYTSTVNSAAEFHFTGTTFTLTYAKYSGYGSMDVYVDGIKIDTISAYSPSLVWQATWSPSASFTAAEHTVRFVFTGPAGKSVDVDSIVIPP